MLLPGIPPKYALLRIREQRERNIAGQGEGISHIFEFTHSHILASCVYEDGWMLYNKVMNPLPYASSHHLMNIVMFILW